jgi:hypothetical protein
MKKSIFSRQLGCRDVSTCKSVMSACGKELAMFRLANNLTSTKKTLVRVANGVEQCH